MNPECSKQNSCPSAPKGMYSIQLIKPAIEF